MYRIDHSKGEGYANTVTPVLRQSNGFFAPCGATAAQGFCADGVVYALPGWGEAMQRAEATWRLVDGTALLTQARRALEEALRTLHAREQSGASSLQGESMQEEEPT